jgi:predicted nucleic acid-binding protein
LILVDANLLLYAYHPRAEQHEVARAWLEGILSGSELVRFAWVTVRAFLRSPRIRVCSSVPVRRRTLSSESRELPALDLAGYGLSGRSNSTKGPGDVS